MVPGERDLLQSLGPGVRDRYERSATIGGIRMALHEAAGEEPVDSLLHRLPPKPTATRNRGSGIWAMLHQPEHLPLCRADSDGVPQFVAGPKETAVDSEYCVDHVEEQTSRDPIHEANLARLDRGLSKW